MKLFAAFAVELCGPCISESLTQQLVTPIQKMTMHFYSEKMRVDRDVNKDSALEQLKQHYNVTNKKNKNKKRKRSAESDDSSAEQDNIPLKYVRAHGHRIAQTSIRCQTVSTGPV